MPLVNYFVNLRNVGFSSSPMKALRHISQCDLFFATRYHSLVFALCSQTPCIPFLYAAKCKDLMEDLEEDMSYSIDKMEIIESFNQTIDKFVNPSPYKLSLEKLNALQQNARTQISMATSSM